MKIVAQSLPTRCEVCHQSDRFQPNNGHCNRCARLIIDLTVNDNGSVIAPMKGSIGHRYLFRLSLLQRYFPWSCRAGRFLKPFLVSFIPVITFGKMIEATIVIFIISFIAAIAWPPCGFRSHRRIANGGSAIESLRIFHTVETDFRDTIGKGDFASPAQLFLNDFIDASIADAAHVPAITSLNGMHSSGNHQPKSGYYFYFYQSDSNPGQSAKFKVWALAAKPTGLDRSGDRNFFVDETGIIRATTTATVVPDENSTPLSN